MKLLVTGGAGFIGSAFVRAALGQGAAVVTLDRLTYAGSLDNLSEVMASPGHAFVEGDIADGALLARLFERHAPEAVVHLAAETHVDRSLVSALPFVETNAVGTARLLEAALRHWRGLAPAAAAAFRFLAVSTDEVFGSLGADGLFDEASPLRPRSPYAASKAAGDHLVAAFHHSHGLPTLIVHCGNNFGPRQFPEKLLPLMILNGREGRALPIYGDGRQVRDNPTTPQRVAGERMEPPVSVPMAKPTRPAADAAAEPAEEPLEPWLGSQGLLVRPPNQLAPNASSPVLSLATRIAPASSRRSTTVASTSMTWSRNGSAPQVVG